MRNGLKQQRMFEIGEENIYGDSTAAFKCRKDCHVEKGNWACSVI